MSPMSKDNLSDHLTKNAIDFLIRAIEDFKTQPKYSIIHFYSAVELFLKARLLSEHWSLVVQRDPDRLKFEAGDFIAVTFADACARLEKVVQSPIPDNARKNFDAIRKHRNKMVHFFHEATLSSEAQIAAIAQEQLRAWYDLNKLLTVQWRSVFRRYGRQFRDIESRLSDHRAYLRAKFEDLEPDIEAEKTKGVNFRACGSCGFEASKINVILGALSGAECLVCRYKDKWLDLVCPDCGKTSALTEGGEFACQFCDHKLSQDELVDEINQFSITKDNYFEANVPANCSECEGHGSVVLYEDNYLCVNCLRLTDSVNACQWCGEHSNGSMEDSYWLGCSMCEGSRGWHKDD